MKLSVYLKNIGILIVLFFLLSAFIGTDKSVLGSFLSLSFVAAIVVIAASRLFLKEISYSRIIITAFFIKYLISILHYLFFFDGSYFSGDGSILSTLQLDFTGYYDYVTRLIEEKHLNSILYFDSSVRVTSHQPILNVIATCLFFYGNKVLNMAPLNSMFGCLAVINLIIAFDKVYGECEHKKKFIYLIAYFPILLDCSCYSRDILGEYCMSISLCLLVLSKEYWRWICLIPSAYLMMLQRDMYALVPVAVFILMSFGKIQNKNSFLFMLIGLFVGIYFFSSILGESMNEELEMRSDIQGYSQTSLLNWPIRFVMALVGPFPWTQILRASVIPAYSSQIYQYYGGLLHIAMIIALIKSKVMTRQWLSNPIFMTGIILMIMAIVNRNMHMSYVLAGSFFVLPVIYKSVSEYDFSSSMRWAFIFLILLNLFIIYVGGGFSASIL